MNLFVLGKCIANFTKMSQQQNIDEKPKAREIGISVPYIKSILETPPIVVSHTNELNPNFVDFPGIYEPTFSGSRGPIPGYSRGISMISPEGNPFYPFLRFRYKEDRPRSSLTTNSLLRETITFQGAKPPNEAQQFDSPIVLGAFPNLQYQPKNYPNLNLLSHTMTIGSSIGLFTRNPYLFWFSFITGLAQQGSDLYPQSPEYSTPGIRPVGATSERDINKALEIFAMPIIVPPRLSMHEGKTYREQLLDTRMTVADMVRSGLEAARGRWFWLPFRNQRFLGYLRESIRKNKEIPQFFDTVRGVDNVVNYLWAASFKTSPDIGPRTPLGSVGRGIGQFGSALSGAAQHFWNMIPGMGRYFDYINIPDTFGGYIAEFGENDPTVWFTILGPAYHEISKATGEPSFPQKAYQHLDPWMAYFLSEIFGMKGASHTVLPIAASKTVGEISKQIFSTESSAEQPMFQSGDIEQSARRAALSAVLYLSSFPLNAFIALAEFNSRGIKLPNGAAVKSYISTDNYEEMEDFVAEVEKIYNFREKVMKTFFEDRLKENIRAVLGQVDEGVINTYIQRVFEDPRYIFSGEKINEGGGISFYDISVKLGERIEQERGKLNGNISGVRELYFLLEALGDFSLYSIWFLAARLKDNPILRAENSSSISDALIYHSDDLMKQIPKIYNIMSDVAYKNGKRDFGYYFSMLAYYFNRVSENFYSSRALNKLVENGVITGQDLQAYLSLKFPTPPIPAGPPVSTFPKGR